MKQNWRQMSHDILCQLFLQQFRKTNFCQKQILSLGRESISKLYLNTFRDNGHPMVTFICSHSLYFFISIILKRKKTLDAFVYTLSHDGRMRLRCGSNADLNITLSPKIEEFFRTKWKLWKELWSKKTFSCFSNEFCCLHFNLTYLKMKYFSL